MSHRDFHSGFEEPTHQPGDDVVVLFERKVPGVEEMEVLELASSKSVPAVLRGSVSHREVYKTMRG